MIAARPLALTLMVCAAVAVPAAQPRLEVLPVQGNVFVIAGPLGNTTVQVGSEGALVVDTQPAALSGAVLEAIRALTPQPIRHIVLTSSDDQAAGGAGALSKAGRYVRVIDSIDPRGSDVRASIIAHLNVLNRMNATKAPSDGWPTDTYFTNLWSLFSNGEAVRFIHVPAGHTDGDTMVFFRRSDVISTGAIFDTTAYPRFDPDRGGSINGVLDALNRVIEIAVAGESQQGGTVIVPGRGRLSDQTEVANYRDMATIVRDRVRDAIQKGRSLDDVKGAMLTLDYDGLFDAGADGWNGERFVEAIYRDLSRRTR
jgi:glyoxylase-like metal-dependent hydrolase (beta-lactamase superfamily II)